MQLNKSDKWFKETIKNMDSIPAAMAACRKRRKMYLILTYTSVFVASLSLYCNIAVSAMNVGLAAMFIASYYCFDNKVKQLLFVEHIFNRSDT